MTDFTVVYSYLRFILFAIIALIAFIYIVLIILMRRYQDHNTILTLNISLATMVCSIFWAAFYARFKFDSMDLVKTLLKSCDLIVIVSTSLTLQVPLSFVTASINRLFLVICHNNHLFKQKRWIFICIISQWIFGTLITLPVLAGVTPVSFVFR